MIDQTLLPDELKIIKCIAIFIIGNNVNDIIDAIKTMKIRGAPAIGAAGGYGMLLGAKEFTGNDYKEMLKYLKEMKIKIDKSRPTAVNLMWATKRVIDNIMECKSKDEILNKVEEIANDICKEDIEINKKMGENGSKVVLPNSNILHHCNTGALATVDIGTALGVIYTCHKQGKNIHVYVDETRPRLQGARLTAWELTKVGVPMHLIADNAAGSLMLQGKIDIVLYGADRVAANGDVANKIGTYQISVLAHENGIPVYPVVPTSTIDLNTLTGKDIPIEERNEEEVTMINNTRIAPKDVKVYNPAFDVTPHKYITGIITEEGICYPPFEISLKEAKLKAEKKIIS